MTPGPYSVYGCWADSRERFAAVYEAGSPRGAENTAQAGALAEGSPLWVCRVVEGEHAAADTYTAFVDPDDPRNLDCEGLVPDMPALEGDPEWTVFGIALPPGTADRDMRRTGERYGDIVAATSAGAAEDVARSRIADQGGVLLVCAVLEGQVTASDTYAAFVDPDVRPASAMNGAPR